MGKGKGMGKYYVRKDGTTIKDDHVDRRYKGGKVQLAFGENSKFEGTTKKEYTVARAGKSGTQTVVADSAERARSQTSGGRVIESQAVSRNKAKSASEKNVKRSRRNKRKKK